MKNPYVADMLDIRSTSPTIDIKKISPTVDTSIQNDFNLDKVSEHRSPYAEALLEIRSPDDVQLGDVYHKMAPTPSEYHKMNNTDFTDYFDIIGGHAIASTNVNHNDIQANRQGGWELAGKSSVQFLATALGELITVSGAALALPRMITGGIQYAVTGDTSIIAGLQNSPEGYMMQQGVAFQDYIRNEFNIKTTVADQESFNLSSATWWASNAPSVASAIASIIPTTAVVKGISKLGATLATAGVRLANKSASAAVTKGAMKYISGMGVGTGNTIKGIGNYMTSGFNEKLLYTAISANSDVLIEIAHSYKDKISEYLSEGLTQEQAEAAFGEYAADAYVTGVTAGLAFNALEARLMLGKGARFKAANANVDDVLSKYKAARLSGEASVSMEQLTAGKDEIIKLLSKGTFGKNAAGTTLAMINEGFEEMRVDFILNEADRNARIKNNMIIFEDGQHIGDRIINHLSEGKNWTSGFFGSFGAGISKGITAKKSHRADLNGQAAYVQKILGSVGAIDNIMVKTLFSGPSVFSGVAGDATDHVVYNQEDSDTKILAPIHDIVQTVMTEIPEGGTTHLDTYLRGLSKMTDSELATYMGVDESDVDFQESRAFIKQVANELDVAKDIRTKVQRQYSRKAVPNKEDKIKYHSALNYANNYNARLLARIDNELKNNVNSDVEIQALKESLKQHDPKYKAYVDARVEYTAKQLELKQMVQAMVEDSAKAYDFVVPNESDLETLEAEIADLNAQLKESILRGATAGASDSNALTAELNEGSRLIKEIENKKAAHRGITELQEYAKTAKQMGDAILKERSETRAVIEAEIHKRIAHLVDRQTALREAFVKDGFISTEDMAALDAIDASVNEMTAKYQSAYSPMITLKADIMKENEAIVDHVKSLSDGRYDDHVGQMTSLRDKINNITNVKKLKKAIGNAKNVEELVQISVSGRKSDWYGDITPETHTEVINLIKAKQIELENKAHAKGDPNANEYTAPLTPATEPVVEPTDSPITDTTDETNESPESTDSVPTDNAVDATTAAVKTIVDDPTQPHLVAHHRPFETYSLNTDSINMGEIIYMDNNMPKISNIVLSIDKNGKYYATTIIGTRNASVTSMKLDTNVTINGVEYKTSAIFVNVDNVTISLTNKDGHTITIPMQVIELNALREDILDILISSDSKDTNPIQLKNNVFQMVARLRETMDLVMSDRAIMDSVLYKQLDTSKHPMGAHLDMIESISRFIDLIDHMYPDSLTHPLVNGIDTALHAIKVYVNLCNTPDFINGMPESSVPKVAYNIAFAYYKSGHITDVYLEVYSHAARAASEEVASNFQFSENRNQAIKDRHLSKPIPTEPIIDNTVKVPTETQNSTEPVDEHTVTTENDTEELDTNGTSEDELTISEIADAEAAAVAEIISRNDLTGNAVVDYVPGTNFFSDTLSPNQLQHFSKLINITKSILSKSPNSKITLNDVIQYMYIMYPSEATFINAVFAIQSDFQQAANIKYWAKANPNEFAEYAKANPKGAAIMSDLMNLISDRFLNAVISKNAISEIFKQISTNRLVVFDGVRSEFDLFKQIIDDAKPSDKVKVNIFENGKDQESTISVEDVYRIQSQMETTNEVQARKTNNGYKLYVEYDGRLIEISSVSNLRSANIKVVNGHLITPFQTEAFKEITSNLNNATKQYIKFNSRNYGYTVWGEFKTLHTFIETYHRNPSDFNKAQLIDFIRATINAHKPNTKSKSQINTTAIFTNLVNAVIEFTNLQETTASTTVSTKGVEFEAYVTPKFIANIYELTSQIFNNKGVKANDSSLQEAASEKLIESINAVIPMVIDNFRNQYARRRELAKALKVRSLSLVKITGRTNGSNSFADTTESVSLQTALNTNDTKNVPLFYYPNTNDRTDGVAFNVSSADKDTYEAAARLITTNSKSPYYTFVRHPSGRISPVPVRINSANVSNNIASKKYMDHVWNTIFNTIRDAVKNKATTHVTNFNFGNGNMTIDEILDDMVDVIATGINDNGKAFFTFSHSEDTLTIEYIDTLKGNGTPVHTTVDIIFDENGVPIKYNTQTQNGFLETHLFEYKTENFIAEAVEAVMYNPKGVAILDNTHAGVNMSNKKFSRIKTRDGSSFTATRKTLPPDKYKTSNTKDKSKTNRFVPIQNHMLDVAGSYANILEYYMQTSMLVTNIVPVLDEAGKILSYVSAKGSYVPTYNIAVNSNSSITREQFAAAMQKYDSVTDAIADFIRHKSEFAKYNYNVFNAFYEGNTRIDASTDIIKFIKTLSADGKFTLENDVNSEAAMMHNNGSIAMNMARGANQQFDPNAYLRFIYHEVIHKALTEKVSNKSLAENMDDIVDMLMRLNEIRDDQSILKDHRDNINELFRHVFGRHKIDNKTSADRIKEIISNNKSWQELFTYAFTNRYIADTLNKLEYAGPVKIVKRTTLWDKIVNMFIKLLNIDISEKSYLNAIKAMSTKMMSNGRNPRPPKPSNPNNKNDDANGAEQVQPPPPVAHNRMDASLDPAVQDKVDSPPTTVVGKLVEVVKKTNRKKTKPPVTNTDSDIDAIDFQNVVDYTPSTSSIDFGIEQLGAEVEPAHILSLIYPNNSLHLQIQSSIDTYRSNQTTNNIKIC